MYEVSDMAGEAVILGSDLGGFRPSARRTLQKLRLQRGALEWLKARPFVSGRQVDVIVGHVVAACLLPEGGTQRSKGPVFLHLRTLLLATAVVGLGGL